MATEQVITRGLLSQIESLLGKAYSNLKDSIGDKDTPNTIMHSINKAKLVVRGGHDSGFGVKTDPEESFTVSDQSGGTLRIPTTKLLFGDKEKILPQTDISLANSNLGFEQPTSDGFMRPVYVVAYDATLFGESDEITVGAWASPSVSYQIEVNTGGAAVLPTDKELFPDFSNISIDKRFKHGILLLSKSVLNPNNTIDSSTDATNFTHYYGSEDDDVVLDVFEGLTKAEASVKQGIITNNFKDAISALSKHVMSRTRKDFKTYWAEQEYEFSNEFRELYSKTANDELVVNMCKATLNGVVNYTHLETFKPTFLEAVVPNKTIPQGQTLAFNVYPYKGGAYDSVLSAGVTLPSSGSISMGVYASTTNWPDTGFVEVKPVKLNLEFYTELGNPTYDSVIGSYTKTNDKNVINYTKVRGTSLRILPWLSTIRVLDKVTCTLSGTLPAATPVAISSTNKYLGVGHIEITTAPDSTYQVVVRSK